MPLSTTLLLCLAKSSFSLSGFRMDEDMGNCMVKGIAQARNGRLIQNPEYPFSSRSRHLKQYPMKEGKAMPSEVRVLDTSGLNPVDVTSYPEVAMML